jgi:hypothetical protein
MVSKPAFGACTMGLNPNFAYLHTVILQEVEMTVEIVANEFVQHCCCIPTKWKTK